MSVDRLGLIDRTIPAACAAAFVAALAALACAPAAPAEQDVPWDVSLMTRELARSVAQYRQLTVEVRESRLLAWQRVRDPVRPEPLPWPPGRESVEQGLVWMRVQHGAARSSWIVVHGFRRGQEGRWELPFRNRSYQKVPAKLDPGESEDGTWPGHALYATPPTAQEICDFAKVEFLRRYVFPSSDNRLPGEWIGDFRRNAWLGIADGPPPCGFERLP